MAEPNTPFKPYQRDPITLARKWATPGTEGLRHRIGGLEKENITGSVSTDPLNHELMVKLRQEKVDKVADFIPEQSVTGDKTGDLLVVSCEVIEGSVRLPFRKCKKMGTGSSGAHFHSYALTQKHC